MQSDLYPQPLDVLREVFGYQSFRSGQDAVIEQLVAGNDVLAIMPTGYPAEDAKPAKWHTDSKDITEMVTYL